MTRAVALAAVAAVLPMALALDDGTARTPPMGWSSYNAFLRDYHEDDLYPNVELMESLGLLAAGYSYFNVDGVWWNGDHERGEVFRNRSGHFVQPTNKFPSGVRRFSDHVHAHGLKLGWYTSARKTACCCSPRRMRPMSQDYEQLDFELMREWNVDYIKVDNCGTEHGLSNSAAMYRWRNLVSGTGIVLENCRVGCMARTDRRKRLLSPNRQHIEGWCEDVAHLSRISKDLGVYQNGGTRNGTRQASWSSIMYNARASRSLEAHSGPGHWLHLDTLDVGNGGLTIDENRAHFGIWSIVSSPLIFGTDLREIKEEHLAILLNERAIRVNQLYESDSGRLIHEYNSGLQLWAKRLPNRELAVLVVNDNDEDSAPLDYTLRFADAESWYPELVRHLAGDELERKRMSCLVTDVWSGEQTRLTSQHTVTVSPHQGVFLTLGDCAPAVPCSERSKRCESGRFASEKRCQKNAKRRAKCMWCPDVGCRSRAEGNCAAVSVFADCPASGSDTTSRLLLASSEE